MVPLIGHANIMRYACIQSCRIDVGVVYLMIIRISVQLGLKTYYDILLVNKQKREMNVIKGKASHNVRMANEFDMYLNSWLDPGNKFLWAISLHC